MVLSRQVLSGLLAFGLAGRCFAGYNGTHVAYIPESTEWDGAGTNLTVTFDTVSADYVSLYAQDGELAKRTGIATAVAYATYIAAIIKANPTADSCTITYGVDSEESYVEGYAYEATTSGSNCETTAEKKTILAAVEKCATALNAAGAVRGCCTMTHGRTWEGHLRLTAEPSVYPATTVTC
ncbi:hypothetical protein ASPACDRAFT_62435 [Aspergillus aculeatus ATCC 16872]|uniref:Secreted protein CSS2 C-terminal domain-containing protein n=1 Tax=Aspergillus aculeatus (strain ATCC 16872 / CBS 172.66 / WB 5094) TaxID=690307 RepID=A0A1L9WML3_ASPA1|nr:uncharacterized protein ASPACDRAFT_62435 [Aspergillus aculeatus ATCC 16872]OJJ97405.1 hypothetical protein ASPACDRAFT_62435 [Aspergillus aculeatus ATCC 16872]